MGFRYNASGIKEQGSYPLLEKNRYILKIESAEQTQTKKGYPMVTVNFVVQYGDYAGWRIKYHNVVFLPADSSGAGISIHFLKTIGEPYKGDFDVNPQNWIGKLLIGLVEQEPDLKGILRNVVKAVEPYEDIIKPKQESQEFLSQEEAF